jgi:hypothetical protein
VDENIEKIITMKEECSRVRNKIKQDINKYLNQQSCRFIPRNDFDW